MAAITGRVKKKKLMQNMLGNVMFISDFKELLSIPRNLEGHTCTEVCTCPRVCECPGRQEKALGLIFDSEVL